MKIFLPVLLLPSLALADGAVMLFPAIGTPSQVSVSGRVFKDEPSKGSSTLSRNLRRLMVSNWEGAPVTVRYAGKETTVTSGHDGNFEAVFTATAPATFPLTPANAEAHVVGAKVGIAPVELLEATSPFFVVSDFDDTVAISQVLDKRKLIANSLLKDESTQAVVKGMPGFYGCLREKPSKPAFALVSGSPIQYVPRITSFLTRHAFPPMGLYLRDFGPTTLSGYKQPVIRGLLKGIANKVVLVGDSGEHDPEVYKQINAEFPERVLRIYIRNAGRVEDKTRFTGMVLFNDPKEAALDAVANALASKECVTKAFP